MARSLRKAAHFRGKARRGRRMEVAYHVLSHGEAGPEQRAVTRNIGVGGAFIETPDPAPPGTSLTVMVKLDGGPMIEVAADVRWIVDGDYDAVHGMGVKFSGLGPEELRSLNEFFASLPDAADLEELL
jgi:hypothetical protein